MRATTLIIALGLIAGAPALAAAKADEDHGNRMQQRFERMDLDGNGRITLEELAEIRGKRLAKADADGDGALTLDEIKAASKRDGERLERRFQRMDQNGDGKVTKEESTAIATAWFEKVDKNGDGGITIGELQQWRPDGSGNRGSRGDRGDGGERGDAN